MGNTVLVIEHDIEIMRATDYIVDFGPEAGKVGGEIVAAGTTDEIAACESSFTGRCLSGIDKINIPTKRRTDNGKSISISNAHKHNLKNIDVDLPLGMLVSLTGVSGSGKSTLLFDILGREAEIYFGHSKEKPDHQEISGLENVSDIITIDQSPIGRTSRSNAATKLRTAVRSFCLSFVKNRYFTVLCVFSLMTTAIPAASTATASDISTLIHVSSCPVTGSSA